MGEEKGLKNWKNLFKWGGWRNEIGWILFWLFLLYLIFAYRIDVGTCNAQLDTICVKQCRLEDYREDFIKKNPGTQVTCDIDTMTCEISGGTFPEQLDFNSSLWNTTING